MKRRILSLMLAAMLVFALTSCNKEKPPEQTPGVTIGTEPPITDTTDEPKVQPFVAPKELITLEVDKLMSGDKDTVAKLFGQSDVYSPEAVQDRVAVTRITFVDAIVDGETISDLASVVGKANTEITVNTHICTINYLATKEAATEIKARLTTENPEITPEELTEQVENEIATMTKHGDFDFHVTIPVVISYDDLDGQVVITELFKTAITGGWYNSTGAELTSGECPVNTSSTAGQADNSVIEQYKAPDMAPPESSTSPFDIS